MMTLCNGFNKLNGCGNCQISVYNTKLIESVSPKHIAKLLTTIPNLNNFRTSHIDSSKFKDLLITCNGSTHMIIDGNSPYVHYSKALDICRYIMKEWCRYNTNDIYKPAREKILNCRNKVINTNNIYQVRHTLRNLYDDIYSLYVCNGNCTSPVHNKQISKCTFKLTDSIAVCNFDVRGLINTLSLITSTFIDADDCKVFLDLNETFIRCNGNVFSNASFITCSSTFDQVKTFCLRYLVMWSKNNCYKTYDISIVNLLVKSVNKAKTVSNIYDECDLMFEKLSV